MTRLDIFYHFPPEREYRTRIARLGAWASN